MKLSKQSVRHPIGVTMVMLMVVIFGFVSSVSWLFNSFSYLFPQIFEQFAEPIFII